MSHVLLILLKMHMRIKWSVSLNRLKEEIFFKPNFYFCFYLFIKKTINQNIVVN